MATLYSPVADTGAILDTGLSKSTKCTLCSGEFEGELCSLACQRLAELHALMAKGDKSPQVAVVILEVYF